MPRMQPNKLSRRRRETLTAYLFLTPDLVGLAIFALFPMVYALWISFHQWDALSPMHWVGWRNYSDMFADAEWWQSLGTTFLYTAMFVPALYVVSLALALMVDALPRLKGTFRMIFFLPVIMSPAIAGLIWQYLMDYKLGAVNSILALVGLPSIPWIASANMSLVSVIIVSVWLNMGFYMIIFLAGLQDIPRIYYEAAKIDGATPTQSFLYITLPNLKYTSVFVLIIAMIGSFQVFDQVQLMTNGGPGHSTLVSVLYIYQVAFQQFDMGYASTLSFCLFFIILVLTIFQLKVTKSYK